MRSGCRYDAPTHLTVLGYLAPAASRVELLPRLRAIGIPDARRPLAGSLRIDSPPPERA